MYFVSVRSVGQSSGSCFREEEWSWHSEALPCLPERRGLVWPHSPRSHQDLWIGLSVLVVLLGLNDIHFWELLRSYSVEAAVFKTFFFIPAPRSGSLCQVLVPLRTPPSCGAASHIQSSRQCSRAAENQLSLHLAGDQVHLSAADISYLYVVTKYNTKGIIIFAMLFYFHYIPLFT